MAIRFWQLQKSMNNRDSNVRNIFFLSLALNLVLWGVVLITFPKNSPTSILHYTAGIGVDFIGNGWQIITLPAIGTLLLIVNSVLARIVEGTSKLAFWMLWGSIPLMQCVLLATYALLLTFNT